MRGTAKRSRWRAIIVEANRPNKEQRNVVLFTPARVAQFPRAELPSLLETTGDLETD